jgi:hypothetical protein
VYAFKSRDVSEEEEERHGEEEEDEEDAKACENTSMLSRAALRCVREGMWINAENSAVFRLRDLHVMEVSDVLFARFTSSSSTRDLEASIEKEVRLGLAAKIAPPSSGRFEQVSV